MKNKRLMIITLTICSFLLTLGLYGGPIGLKTNSLFTLHMATVLGYEYRPNDPYIAAIVGRGKLAPVSKVELDIIEYLISLGISINDSNEHTGNSALITAAEKLDMRTVKYLLERGALVNKTNQIGYTAAMTVCSQSGDAALAVIKLLNQYQANLLITTNDGESCMSLAKSHGDGIKMNSYRESRVLLFIESTLEIKSVP